MSISFRPRYHSARLGARDLSRDLGATVELVGPGPAYDYWKKTLEYQQWLKDTGQVR